MITTHRLRLLHRLRRRLHRLRRRPRSLRTTVTAAAALTVLIVVALAGVVIALRLHSQDLHQVDQELRSRAMKVSTDAAKLAGTGQTGSGTGDDTSGGIDHDVAGLDAGSQTLVRVFAGNTVVSQHGDVPAGDIPTPTSDGLSTVSIAGQDWRSLVESLPGGRVQLLENLAPVQQRLHDTEQVVVIVAAVATVLSAITAWLATGAALDPLQRLRAGAARIRADRGHDQRLPETRRPQEVAELTDTLNGMLDELDASMQSTRRFTADAGHELRTPLTSLGIDLETLRRNPDLPADERGAMLAAMTAEHTRITRLLTGLQNLARGDAHALPRSTPVDITDLIEDCVNQARRRHPDTHITLTDTDPDGEVPMQGWVDGLRVALSNLLDNAALHGRAHGHVDVTLTTDSTSIRITIDDDGPGIPPDAHAAMLERFARGDTSAPGSGLGLALAQQQATLHGGRLHMATAPAGGLRVQLQLPRTV